jgi:hypothetical protein
MLDQKLYDMAEHNLFYGNNEAVGMWANAIKNYRQYKNTWDSKGGILNKLTKQDVIDGPVVLGVAPEAAAKAILGSSFSDLISKPETIRTLKTLKEQLPEVEWNMLRQEAFMQISDGIVSNATGRASNTFSREWRTARQRNPMLLTTLFTPDEMVLMNNLADTTARVVRTEKNTSNSGAAIGTLLGRLFRKMGDTNVANAVAEWFLVNGAVRSYAGSRVKSAVKGVAGQRARSGLNNLILGGSTGFGSTRRTSTRVRPVIDRTCCYRLRLESCLAHHPHVACRVLAEGNRLPPHLPWPKDQRTWAAGKC